MYVINSITVWAKKWKKNDWKKADNKDIENKELIKSLHYLSKNLGVKYVHVKAHKTAPNKDSDEYFIWYGNMMADTLATSCIK
jgi:ribonuclease HI